ncbi:hypothetical protein [Streptomyces sp. IBSBF 3136]|uniref:hypothetical protein n=1 Tax=Streptomyces sp. IBSBF 3136 TaxID=2903524 RepID=UPI002FDBA807
MLRILDARTGEPVAAAPARRGLTRIEAYASGLDPTALRVLLTADLLVRALELGGTPVWAILTAPHRPAELRTAATALAIRPFEDGRDLASGLGEAQVIHVVAQDTQGPRGEGPLLTVAPVTWTGAAGQDEAGAVDAAERATDGEVVTVDGAQRATDGEVDTVDGAAGAPDGAGPGAGPSEAAGPATLDAEPPSERPAPSAGPAASDAVPPWDLSALLADPAALRLSLLSVPRGTPVRLDPAGLAEAARTLAGWRRAVAGWSRQPSRPVPEEVRMRLRAAWEDDLDLPGVLTVLRDVADAPGLPDGARFETYVYADRLLALDLARDLGSLA